MQSNLSSKQPLLVNIKIYCSIIVYIQSQIKLLFPLHLDNSTTRSTHSLYLSQTYDLNIIAYYSDVGTIYSPHLVTIPLRLMQRLNQEPWLLQQTLFIVSNVQSKRAQSTTANCLKDSLTLAIAGFHSSLPSPNVSERLAGFPFFCPGIFKQDIKRCNGALGINRIITPTGIDINPRPNGIAHCSPVKLVTWNAALPKLTMNACPPIRTQGIDQPKFP